MKILRVNNFKGNCYMLQQQRSSTYPLASPVSWPSPSPSRRIIAIKLFCIRYLHLSRHGIWQAKLYPWSYLIWKIMANPLLFLFRMMLEKGGGSIFPHVGRIRRPTFLDGPKPPMALIVFSVSVREAKGLMNFMPFCCHWLCDTRNRYLLVGLVVWLQNPCFPYVQGMTLLQAG